MERCPDAPPRLADVARAAMMVKSAGLARVGVDHDPLDLLCGIEAEWATAPAAVAVAAAVMMTR